MNRLMGVVLGSAVAVLCGCQRTEPDRLKPAALEQASWQESPHLDLEQKHMLDALRVETLGHGGVFGVQVWDVGNTVLDLEVLWQPDRPGGTDAEVALAFLEKHAVLWKLSDRFSNDDLVVVKPHELGMCTDVVVQLVDDGEAVFNATLTVQLRAGNVVRVTGYMNGAPLATPRPEVNIAREDAAAVLSLARGWPEEAAQALDAPQLVVFDRFFVSEPTRQTRRAWYFQAESGEVNDGLLVDATTGELLIEGASLPENRVTRKGVCELGSQSTVWVPAVVVEDEAGPLSPGFVSFTHFGGVRTEATVPHQQVMEVMATKSMRRMFGDAAPSEHLALKNVSTSGGITQLSYAEVFAGHEVEGAYLQAVVSNGRVQQMFSRLSYFPAYPPPVMDIAQARTSAQSWYVDTYCASLDTQYVQSCIDTASPLDEAEVIFAPEIIGDLPVGEPQLTYRAKFPHLTLWWSLSSDRLVFSTESVSEFSQFRIWTSLGTEGGCTGMLCAYHIFRQSDYRLERDFDGTLFPPLHPDSVDMANALALTESRLLQDFGWNSVLGDGGVASDRSDAPIHVIVGIDTEKERDSAQTAEYGNGPTRALGIRMGVNAAAEDVLAHEYVHHVTNSAFVSFRGLEQGAIAESYSDAIALTLWPPANEGWVIGSQTSRGAWRDMLDPKSLSTLEGVSAVDHVENKSNCDSTRVNCTYEWLGIPNKAFALIAAGVSNPVPGTTPFGRLMTARFYFETIRGSDESARQMASADRFLNQRTKLLSVCERAVGESSQHLSERWRKGRVVTYDDCANVARAFDEVGVTAVRRSGFDRYDVGLESGGARTERAAGRFRNGCSIRGHRLFVEVSRRNALFPFQLSRTDQDSPPLDINYLDGELTAKFVKRCGGVADMSLCPDSADREVRYEYAAKWETVSRYLFVDEEVEPAEWMNGDKSLCDDGPLQVYQSTPVSSLISGFIFGHSKSIQLDFQRDAPPSYIVAPCDLVEIGVIDEHRSSDGSLILHPVHPAVEMPDRVIVSSDYSHESHGLYVSYLGQNYRDYHTQMNVWADAFSAAFGRVVYVVSGPPNSTCGFQSTAGRGIAPLPPSGTP